MKAKSQPAIADLYRANLNQLLDKMRVSVAPLRYGAGIKGKIGSAMAVGLPVVGTSLAVEGMSLTHGENVLVADGARAFASAIVRVYESADLWTKLSTEGLKFSERAWGAEAAWTTVQDLLTNMGFAASQRAHPLKLFSSSRRSSEVGRTSRPVDKLMPVFVARGRAEYEEGIQRNEFEGIRRVELSLIAAARSESFTVDGFCVPCARTVAFRVDMLAGGQRTGDSWTPNWRERLLCPLCQMNNRQRLMATLVKDRLQQRMGTTVYFMEQVTPIYNWAMKSFPTHKIIGSEFLGNEYQSGQIVRGIRHEDILNLSFEGGSLDLVVSNDVFEHVPDPLRAFSQCAEVLYPGGVMLASIPFHTAYNKSIARAELLPTGVNHLLQPEYHGNPVSPDGSLVFTDFGWDVIDSLKASGFSDVVMEVYASAELGHMGDGQLIVRATK